MSLEDGLGICYVSVIVFDWLQSCLLLLYYCYYVTTIRAFPLHLTSV